MTPLQQGVIQRLRERGYTALADMAHAAWSKDERMPIPDTPSTAAEKLRSG